MSLKMLLGSRIKQEREAKPMTQERLAELTGRAPRYIQQIEHGECWPGAATLQRIANALGCEPWQLLKPKPQE